MTERTGATAGGKAQRSWTEALRTPGPLLGTFLQIPSPQLVEIIGYTGFDFVILDLEHGEFDLSAIDNLLRAAEIAGLHTIVRVPSNDASLIMKALDFGADGVLVPHIETVEDARAAVAAAKYPPEGTRGAYPFSRATGYRSHYREGWEASQNEQTSVILIVEGIGGIESIPDIVQVPGVAAIFVGPMDLSYALGIPGQLRHPRLEGYAKQIRETAAESGLHTSIYCNDITAAVDYARAGVKLIALSVDAHVISNAYRGLVESFGK